MWVALPWDMRLPSIVLAALLAVPASGCVETDGEPIEVEFGSLDQVSVVLELHGELAEASVVVVEDGHWIDTIAASASVAFEMTSTMDLDLVITGTGPMAPTVPVVIRKPIEGDPEPN